MKILKSKTLLYTLIFTILGNLFAFLDAYSVQSIQFNVQSTPNEYSYFLEQLYCREIDSLVYSYGFEIDGDAIDISNPLQMEEAAIKLIGDNFYTWKYAQSKYALSYQSINTECCY